MSTVPALQRGLDLIERLAAEPAGVPFSSLAERLGVANASLARLLVALVARGYAAKDVATGRYIAGPMCQRLAALGAPEERLRGAAADILPGLAQATGASVLLLAPHPLGCICIDKALSPDGIVGQPVGRVSERPCSDPWMQLLDGGAGGAIADDRAAVFPGVRRWAALVGPRQGALGLLLPAGAANRRRVVEIRRHLADAAAVIAHRLGG